MRLYLQCIRACIQTGASILSHLNVDDFCCCSFSYTNMYNVSLAKWCLTYQEYEIGWEEGAVPKNFQNTHRIPKNSRRLSETRGER